MKYEDAIKYLFSLINYERKIPKGEYDFAGYIKFLNNTGNPEKSLSFPITVVGTKGKGTVAHLLTSIFLSLNKKTGLYTSPHILDVRERIRINFEKIPEQKLAEGIEFIRSKENIKRLTYFEALTTIAFRYFKDEGTEVQILEAGLGGRLDCTNAANQKVTIITKIDYDHERTLGYNIEKIAWEKAGIIKEKNLVISVPQKKRVKKVIEKECIRKKAELFFIGKDIPLEIDGKILKLRINSKTREFPNFLKGDFNSYNIAVSSACGVLLGCENFNFDNFKISGRFDILKENPLLIVDCAHNPLSIYTFLKTLNKEYPGKDFLIIIGVNKDKNLKKVARILKKFDYKIVITKSKSPRASPLKLLEKIFSQEGIKIFDKDEEINNLLSKYSDRDIAVTGSFYLIEEVYRFLNKEPL